MFRTVATFCVSLAVLALPASAQCPDGTPPPCSAPSRPVAPSPRVGVASLRVLASTPVAGTALKWQDLQKGIPLHVVVEHAVQTVPRGLIPVLVAYINLTPDVKGAQQQRVLDARVIAARPTQRGLDWTLTSDYVRQQRITVQIHVAFSAARDTNFARGLRVSFDWAASTTLEFPVADSSGAASTPQLTSTDSASIASAVARELHRGYVSPWPYAFATLPGATDASWQARTVAALRAIDSRAVTQDTTGPVVATEIGELVVRGDSAMVGVSMSRCDGHHLAIETHEYVLRRAPDGWVARRARGGVGDGTCKR